MTALQPPLAIIVPTYRRPTYASATVLQVLAQARPGDEVVVVDQSPEDELVCGLPPQVVVIRRPPGLPAARNAGLAATRAPLVLFLDDDVIVADGCVDAHRRAFVDPTIGGVVGRIRERVLRPNAPPPTNRVGGGGRVRVNLEGTRAAEVEILKGANMSIRRSALEEVGGFDPAYGGTALLEDADLSERLRARGWRIWFSPEAELQHLSAPAGGVRAATALAGEVSRFRNTGLFVRRHRGLAGWVRTGATFAAIAVRRAAQAGDPRVADTLLRALVEGFRAGAPPVG